MTELAALQNGSDIRGIAIDTEEHQANLTPKAMKQIAHGIVTWLRNEKQVKGHPLKIAVGRDSRLSGPVLAEAFMQELVALGVVVLDCQIATTPAMFMSTQFLEFACDAGVMLTASHLPFYFNGVKIFSQAGGAEKSDITQILTKRDQALSVETTGSIQQIDLLTPYAADLVTKIRQGMKTNALRPLSGMKIIVDAGNGAGGFFAEKVLAELGADTTGSQFLEPDGRFPNHIPNPDNKEAMASIQAAVLREQADLGVIFDTDVDRSAMVTKTGEVLNRNNLIAVLSKISLTEHPGTSIVTNSPTSSHLKTFIETLGGKQVRYISGYRNVINKAVALNANGIDCQLAIETSGHAAFKENYFLDDGAYVIAKILMLIPTLKQQGKTLEQLITDLKQPAETQEVRFKLTTDAYRKLGQQVIETVAKLDHPSWTIDPENEEGIRFNVQTPYGSGWFLLRMSLHEPLLVLQVENDEIGQVKHVLAEFPAILAEFPAVDQTALTAYLHQ